MTTDIRAALMTIAAEIERGNHRSAERQIGKLIDSLPPATVGELLATAPVGSIVEWIDGNEWQRMDARRRLGAVEYWCAGDLRWRSDDSRLWPHTLRLPARLVPADQADADPATRGPIGGGR